MTATQLPTALIVPVVAHAISVVGDEEKASHVKTEGGIREVDAILTRIEHNLLLILKGGWRVPCCAAIDLQRVAELSDIEPVWMQ